MNKFLFGATAASIALFGLAGAASAQAVIPSDTGPTSYRSLPAYAAPAGSPGSGLDTAANSGVGAVAPRGGARDGYGRVIAVEPDATGSVAVAPDVIDGTATYRSLPADQAPAGSPNSGVDKPSNSGFGVVVPPGVTR